jgi:hypothetical protein
MTARTKLLGACAAALASACTAVPSADASFVMRDYDLRLSVQMKSNFSFQTVTEDCGGPKQRGYAGAGEEILELRSPKPVRVTLTASPGAVPGVSRKDLKADFPMVGETRRSGSMQGFSCGKQLPNRFADCTGRHRIDTSVGLQFLTRNRWLVSDSLDQSTREVVKACDDGAGFDWDGAVARTGTVLLQSHFGNAPDSKIRKTKGSFSLTAAGRDTCDVDYFGAGTCVTDWSYKATFTPVKKKKRRR